MSTESVESLVRKILEDMNSGDTTTTVSAQTHTPSSSAASPFGNVTTKDYPIAQKHPEWVKTATGKTFKDITLENVMNGTIDAKDVRITSDILKAQGEIAKSAGRSTITRNFSRAAELVSVPDDRILEIYNALRPYRSSKQDLLEIADELDSNYKATITANFIREAAENYEKRKKLKGDDDE
ncbi:diol dehydratase small subunit [Desemzia sp. C1]|uniref:diol dehydratase small subunit n=1 Tax=Desemzia sp. C1 TaxID=2892016 RepID=UPI001E59EA10|nr:diol dehydratase small subunit [Desemzia sp. C1]MCI3029297.1 diol dehydratase small subunit [Desemzia sp. C1]